MAQQPPRIVNSLYRLGPALIPGTVAALFSARYTTTNELVAILLVRPPTKADHSQGQSLLQAAKGLTTLLHPHLLHLHEVGFDQGEYFFITDLRGRPLRERLNQEALSLARALEIARQLTQGINALHSRKIIGLDLSPERINLETSGRTDTALVADIGQRRFLQALGYDEQESAGTSLLHIDPRYAAPEQLQHGSIGPATDVYALGLTLFEMITGRAPFVGRSPAETRALQLSQPVPNLRPLRGEAAPELQGLVEQALSKHPSLRFPDIAAFGAAIESLQERLPKRSGSPSKPMPQLPTFRTAPIETIKNRPDSSPLAAKQPQGTQQTAPTDGPDNEITLDTVSAEEGQTLHIPGRARLLLGESERKKVIPIARFPAILGRADPRRQQRPDIDLAPYDTRRSISRLHARIWREGDLFYIEDLGSVNKTILGELELTPYERQLLRRHDSIKLGLLQMIFEY